MLEGEVKQATCQVACGEEIGTGWLISSNKILTARHCVANALNDVEEVKITLLFNNLDKTQELNAAIVDYDSDLDVCLLTIENSLDINPIALNDATPIGGTEFYSYGWPTSKLSIGHRLEGSISQTLISPEYGMDIDLHIEQSSSLSCYEGLSGAALICEGECVGLIRIAIDKALGAISIPAMRDFLQCNHLLSADTINREPTTPNFAPRTSFTQKFETIINAQSNGYIFIEGAHGIGKSTFCEAYAPIDQLLEHVGTYALTAKQGTINTNQLAQPKEFCDWLNIQTSTVLGLQAKRTVQDNYLEQIKAVNNFLTRLGEKYSANGKTGILFIDGLDEIEKINNELLTNFIGMLPSSAPTGLVIVLTAPNYSKLALPLGERLNSKACLSIPPLEDTIEREFCKQELIITRSIGLIASTICERAQGHPLYLRYLIDLANSGSNVDELAALPLIRGSIRNYYEALWNQLLQDSDAVKLLAIMARLRWGVSINQFSKILYQTELDALTSTIERIRHLLLVPTETTSYHSSFSDFLLEKTLLHEQNIQNRLAEYCQKNTDNQYGLQNIIYHGLKSDRIEKAHIISLCDQKWIDRCVLISAEPDILLEDVENALDTATKTGNFTETIRILLLSHRLQFRYNTLFAQSAVLIADALLSLEKTHEVLKHVVRYDTLIVSPDEALRITHKLIKANNFKSALKLLKIIQRDTEEWFQGKNTVRDLLLFYSLMLQALFLKELAGDQHARTEQSEFVLRWMHVLKKNMKNKDENKYIRNDMAIELRATMMCLTNRYLSIENIKQNYSGPEAELITPLCISIVYYQIYCENYQIRPNQQLLGAAFTDLQDLLSEREITEKVSLYSVAAMISLGAPLSIIQKFSKQYLEKEFSIDFIAKDSVSLDEELLREGMSAWKVQSFMNSDQACPALIPLSPADWKHGISSICKLIAWCEGTARRAVESSDLELLNHVWSKLQKEIFTQLECTLEQRTRWEDSYALPESIIPLIYKEITDLVLSIFPQHLSELLSFIEKQFSKQCGVYSEGFRKILETTLERLTRSQRDNDVEDQAFSLLISWRDFVLANLKNRHELIPELLTIIPLFVRLDASEEAQKTYESALAFSMGPSWYKEDQFNLIISSLSPIDNEASIPEGVLPRMAELLDAADGEMTFQRFVRYAKRDFIGALCKRGNYNGAAGYFIRQTYGSYEELLQDATKDSIDRVSDLKGSRFPGAALDEQDAIWSILQAAIPTVHWPLCWALLEIFQFGDSRHIKNYAACYANLIQQTTGDNDAQTMMLKRIKLICESEIEEEHRSKFLDSVAKELPNDFILKFEQIFGKISKESTHTTRSSSIDSIEHYAQEELQSNDVEEPEDDLRLPGLWGTNKAINEAKEALLNAEKHLRRRNVSEAQKTALDALKKIQTGKWSIWTNTEPEISKAKNILLQTTTSTSETIELFSSLISNEHYAERWLMANNIIEWLGEKANKDEHARLLELTIDHLELLVGTTDNQLESYQFLDNPHEIDAPSCIIKLILHAIDHPTWLRSEKAADMLLWLLKNHSKYIPTIGSKAFSMDSNNHPDVICGVLDQLSNSNPIQLWDQLSPALHIESIMNNCKHLGRLIVLKRIISRAKSNGSTSAHSAFANLQDNIFNQIGTTNILQKTDVECPSWATDFAFQWSKLKELGLTGSELIKQVSNEITKQCSPLSLEMAFEIEQLLAEGFRGYSHTPLRWKAKVRFALNVALLRITPEPLMNQVEEIFRPYNPYDLENLRVIDFSSPTKTWLDQLSEQTPFPVNGREIYLDFYERIWFENQLTFFRVTAYFYHPKRTPLLPSGRFLSNEKPVLKTPSPLDTCANVRALPVFFGSETPAVPTATMQKFITNPRLNLKRAYWRSGRAAESDGGIPNNAGCYLSIDKNALRLPLGFKLAWLFELNGEIIDTITLN